MADLIAEITLEYYVIDPVEQKIDEFTSYYDSVLGKCFVLITYPDGNFGQSLFDAVDRQQYGSYVAGAPLSGTAMACQTLNTHCVTQDEFDAFVKIYMPDFNP